MDRSTFCNRDYFHGDEWHSSDELFVNGPCKFRAACFCEERPFSGFLNRFDVRHFVADDVSVSSRQRHIASRSEARERATYVWWGRNSCKGSSLIFLANAVWSTQWCLKLCFNQSINQYICNATWYRGACYSVDYAKAKRNVLSRVLNVITDGAVRQFRGSEFQSLGAATEKWRAAVSQLCGETICMMSSAIFGQPHYCNWPYYLTALFSISLVRRGLCITISTQVMFVMCKPA